MHVLLAIPYLIGSTLSPRQYPAWSIWMALWGIVVLTWDPQSAWWGSNIYTPLLFLSTAFLLVSALEAFFSHARYFPLAGRVSACLGLLGVSAAMACLHYYKGQAGFTSDSSLGIIRQFALCARVGCTVFLILVIGFWASMPELSWRLGWWSKEFRHLLTVTLVSASFAVGSLTLTRVGWFGWTQSDLVIQVTRAALIIGWIVAAQGWRPSGLYVRARARAYPAAPQSGRWPPKVAVPPHS